MLILSRCCLTSTIIRFFTIICCRTLPFCSCLYWCLLRFLPFKIDLMVKLKAKYMIKPFFHVFTFFYSETSVCVSVISHHLKLLWPTKRASEWKLGFTFIHVSFRVLSNSKRAVRTTFTITFELMTAGHCIVMTRLAAGYILQTTHKHSDWATVHTFPVNEFVTMLGTVCLAPIRKPLCKAWFAE